jgi:hypothetical protein
MNGFEGFILGEGRQAQNNATEFYFYSSQNDRNSMNGGSMDRGDGDGTLLLRVQHFSFAE